MATPEQSVNTIRAKVCLAGVCTVVGLGMGRLDVAIPCVVVTGLLVRKLNQLREQEKSKNLPRGH